MYFTEGIHHFSQVSQIRFKKVILLFNYLDSWVNDSGYKTYNTDFNKGSTLLEYEPPQERVLYKNNSFKVTLRYDFYRPLFISAGTSKVKFEEKKRIVIEFRNRTSYMRYHKLIYIIRNFLSLAIGQIIAPIQVNATILTVPINKPIGQFDPKLVNFLYKFQYIDVLSNQKNLHPEDQLFTFRDVEKNISLYIKNWIEKFENLEAVHELYFSIVNNPTLYLKSKFLNVIYALESYHRQVNSTSSTLRERLRELIYQHRSVKILFIKNNNAFLNRVINTRNYFTHYDSQKRKKALKGIDLLRYTKKLMLLLELCLLSEMGMNNEEIKDLFLKKGKDKFI